MQTVGDAAGVYPYGSFSGAHGYVRRRGSPDFALSRVGSAPQFHSIHTELLKFPSSAARAAPRAGSLRALRLELELS
jgi:hypothetical protein